jgi:hypothetical protein
MVAMPLLFYLNFNEEHRLRPRPLYSWALRIHVYTYSVGTMIKKLHKTNKTITDNTKIQQQIVTFTQRLFP